MDLLAIVPVTENINEYLDWKTVDALKEEYTDALVESMSMGQVYSYLKQIIYNDVSVEDGEAVARKIVRQFGQDFYEDLVNDEKFYCDYEVSEDGQVRINTETAST